MTESHPRGPGNDPLRLHTYTLTVFYIVGVYMMIQTRHQEPKFTTPVRTPNETYPGSFRKLQVQIRPSIGPISAQAVLLVKSALGYYPTGRLRYGQMAEIDYDFDN